MQLGSMFISNCNKLNTIM